MYAFEKPRGNLAKYIFCLLRYLTPKWIKRRINLKFPNPILPEASTKGGIYLNLGCGNKVFSGNWVNFDLSVHSSANLLGDFNKNLPFKDNCFDGIYADNVLEHVEDLINVMNECWRILKEDGMFEIIVPHEKSVWAWVDPTHKRVFNELSWGYFSDIDIFPENLKKSYGIICRFQIEKLINKNRSIHTVLRKKYMG